MSNRVSSATLFSVFEELLRDLNATQKTLRIYAMIFRWLNTLINLLIAIFSIVNTVFAFTEQDTVVRRVFQIINMVMVAGLLGNFGSRKVQASTQISNIDHIVKALTTTMGKLGLGVLPQPLIIDTNFIVAPLPQISIQPIPMAASLPPPKDLGDLVAHSTLKMRLTALESLIESFHP